MACALRENLSNQSSGVQIPRDICTRFGRYLYSRKCSWIIKSVDIWDRAIIIIIVNAILVKGNNLYSIISVHVKKDFLLLTEIPERVSLIDEHTYYTVSHSLGLT